MYIIKTQEYLDYIKEHKENVNKAWVELQQKCKSFSFVYDDWKYHIISDLIKNHDNSKLSHEEFIPYRNKFFPYSDNANNEVDASLFELAWEHHKANNPHHWEYWLNNDPLTVYDKNLYAVEMICDWMAMSYKFGNTAESYYKNSKHKIVLPVEEEYILEIFEAIKNN